MRKPLCPVNPWIAFILCFLIPWFLPGIILAANYHTMGEKKKRNLFIVLWILTYFIGSVVMGLTTVYLHLEHTPTFIFYIWSLMVTLLFAVVQLPDYKNWQKEQQD